MAQASICTGETMEVKYYKRSTFIVCVANSGNYETDAGCLGLVGVGRDETSAYNSFMWQLRQRVDTLSKAIEGKK